MRIFNIVLKEIKHNIRNKQIMVIMIAFPIVLMWILGTAFSGGMEGSSLMFNNPKIVYSIEGQGQRVQAFEEFIKKIEKFGIKPTEIQEYDSGINSVKETQYACYIDFNDNENKIKLFKNERYNVEATFVEGIFQAFVQKYNVISEIAKVNPKAVKEVLKEDSKKYVEVKSIDKKKRPRAIDYYGVTMTTLIIMYGAMSGAYGIRGEKTRKTGNRILTSPIKKYEYFIGKNIGSFVSLLFQLLIVIIFSKYVLKVDWGNNPGIIFLIMASEAFMSIALGIGAAFIFNSEAAMSGVLNIMVPVMIFLGGGYVPLDQFNSELLFNIAKFSPIRWSNDTIFKVIYGGNFSQVFATIAINLIAATVFLTISTLIFRKERA
ncbi:SagG family ABC transporter permease subunit [Clostridium tagluense]|uniref:SagG family ABC transporter permease subunit n=1 Tax=Clostridium tagluense TaxID=360422 RepID=UPI001CF2AD55|nr:SagG family ABC transporter permease subunit [Clostridium tagluense]MCB2296716.1 SagG family ABC transporter permease subunit [Clostridium tagluense]